MTPGPPLQLRYPTKETYDASPTLHTTLPLHQKMSIEWGPHQRIADVFPKKQAVLLPTATHPHLQQPPDRSGAQIKNCLDPAMTPGESHTNASPRPTFLLPSNNCEQPSPPTQAWLQEPLPLLHDNPAAQQKTPTLELPLQFATQPHQQVKTQPQPPH
ncbi:hypothetical protein E4T56_gene11467 [Termitomyces sp. T112]|nr:hypothetical protein E4T56_gene11467 [Termitomyces sp. T112]